MHEQPPDQHGFRPTVHRSPRPSPLHPACQGQHRSAAQGPGRHRGSMERTGQATSSRINSMQRVGPGVPSGGYGALTGVVGTNLTVPMLWLLAGRYNTAEWPCRIGCGIEEFFADPDRRLIVKASTIAGCALVSLCCICCCLWAVSTGVCAQDQAPKLTHRNFDLSFQPISQETLSGNLYRTSVPGGWLLAFKPATSPGGHSMVFIPDASHEWDGKTVPVSR